MWDSIRQDEVRHKLGSIARYTHPNGGQNRILYIALVSRRAIRPENRTLFSRVYCRESWCTCSARAVGALPFACIGFRVVRAYTASSNLRGYLFLRLRWSRWECTDFGLLPLTSRIFHQSIFFVLFLFLLLLLVDGAVDASPRTRGPRSTR